MIKRVLALAALAAGGVATPASAYTDVYVAVGGHGTVVGACAGAAGCHEVRDETVTFRQGVYVHQWIDCTIAQPGPGSVLNCRPKFTVGVDPGCPVGPLTLCAGTIVVDSDRLPQDPVPVLLDALAIPQDPIPLLTEQLPGGGGPGTHCTLPRPVGC